jgi:hypothetical protein
VLGFDMAELLRVIALSLMMRFLALSLAETPWGSWVLWALEMLFERWVSAFRLL